METQTLLTIYDDGTWAQQLLLVEFSETHMRIIANTPMWETTYGESGREYRTRKETDSALSLIAECVPTIKPYHSRYGAFNGSPLEAVFTHNLNKKLGNMIDHPEQFYTELLDETED